MSEDGIVSGWATEKYGTQWLWSSVGAWVTHLHAGVDGRMSGLSREEHRPVQRGSQLEAVKDNSGLNVWRRGSGGRCECDGVWKDIVTRQICLIISHCVRRFLDGSCGKFEAVGLGLVEDVDLTACRSPASAPWLGNCEAGDSALEMRCNAVYNGKQQRSRYGTPIWHSIIIQYAL
jgi:hypothetical protein